MATLTRRVHCSAFRKRFKHSANRKGIYFCGINNLKEVLNSKEFVVALSCLTLFPMPNLRSLRLLVLLVVGFPFLAAHAQETVFDVPSADILDKGKVYGELDGTVRPVNPVATFTPRVVLGVGGNIEAGVNFDGPSTQTPFEQVISPTIKWRLWKNEASGWSFFVGDDLFFPATHRTYDVGNYSYAFFSKTWKHGPRLDLGGYDFTSQVVAKANRAGGQFSFEQPINNRLTLAAEWYTGNHSSGYVNPGAIFKLTAKLTLYTAYQIGNSGVTSGNHMFLWEFGYNFN